MAKQQWAVRFNEKEFNNQLKNLAKSFGGCDMRTQKKVMKRAFSQFVKQNKLTAAFKARVPEGDDTNTWAGSRYKPGLLKKSVGTKVYFSKNNRGGIKPRQWVAKVGLMRSKTKQGFRGIFVDEGTQERFVGAGKNTSKAAKKAYKAGKLRSVGSVAPRPFAAQAERATLGAGRGSFLKYMKDALDYVLSEIPKKPSKKYQGSFKRKFSG
jgi:hypothetical protein